MIRKIATFITVNILAITIAYVVFGLFSSGDFRNGFVGNWLATLTGIIIGIPVAIEISEQQQRRDQHMHQAKIISLLKTELQSDLEAMVRRAPRPDEGGARHVPGNSLKDELWRAFSDGGELQWVKDLDLLDALATAYHDIRVIITLEDSFIRQTLWRDTLGSFPSLSSEFHQADAQVKNSIEKAIAEIDKRLRVGK